MAVLPSLPPPSPRGRKALSGPQVPPHGAMPRMGHPADLQRPEDPYFPRSPPQTLGRSCPLAGVLGPNQRGRLPGWRMLARFTWDPSAQMRAQLGRPLPRSTPPMRGPAPRLCGLPSPALWRTPSCRHHLPSSAEARWRLPPWALVGPFPSLPDTQPSFLINTRSHTGLLLSWLPQQSNSPKG